MFSHQRWIIRMNWSTRGRLPPNAQHNSSLRFGSDHDCFDTVWPFQHLSLKLSYIYEAKPFVISKLEVNAALVAKWPRANLAWKPHYIVYFKLMLCHRPLPLAIFKNCFRLLFALRVISISKF